jgi:hypothetical protein
VRHHDAPPPEPSPIKGRGKEAAAINWFFVTPNVHIIELGRQGSEAAFLTCLRVQARF